LVFLDPLKFFLLLQFSISLLGRPEEIVLASLPCSYLFTFPLDDLPLEISFFRERNPVLLLYPSDSISLHTTNHVRLIVRLKGSTTQVLEGIVTLLRHICQYDSWRFSAHY